MSDGASERAFRRHALAIAIVTTIGALASAAAVYAAVRPADPTLGVLPEISLVDHRGDSFDLSRTRGRPWVASFIFTSCPSTCPKIVGALRELAVAEPGLTLVSFTVDPETDRPEVLRAYAERSGAPWTFVTGPRAHIEGLVTRGFGAAASVGSGLEIVHDGRLWLVDGDNRVRGAFATDLEGLAALRARAEALR